MPGLPGILLLGGFELQVEAYSHRVAQLVNEGKPFKMIEMSINSWSLSENQRARLWLYAWSLQTTARQRHRNRVPERLGDE